MSTTISMDSELASRAEAYAKKTDQTLTKLVETALTDFLERGRSTGRSLPPIPVVTGTTPYSTQELKTLVDAMDAEDDAKRFGR